MRTQTPIAALAALAVALTACGDDAIGSSASSPSVPTTTAAANTTHLP